jgi:hypothetical protein
MLRIVGAIGFVVLVDMVLTLAAEHLPSNYAAGAAFLVWTEYDMTTYLGSCQH